MKGKNLTFDLRGAACPPRRRLVALWAATCIAAAGAGCGPSKDQIRLFRAMYAVRHELHPDYGDAIAILEQVRQDERKKNEFVQYGMCETTAAMLGGDYATADRVGKHAHLAIKKYQDAASETAAALSRESLKFFKGEPHERALLCFNIALACYLSGEYNDARIFFTQSIFATATRDEDMEEFRDDFRLGHYWLGRAFLGLGQEDNARIAFHKSGNRLFHKREEREIKTMKRQRRRAHKKALKAEAVCYKRGTRGKNTVDGIVDLSRGFSRSEMPVVLPGAAGLDPTEAAADSLDVFLTPAFQKDVNLVLVVEMGWGPVKYLRGSGAALDDYMRSQYVERAVDVYVDGHQSGPAFCLADTYHQAITRGVKSRRGRQVGKAVTKEILSHAPYAGWLVGYWDVSADARYWPSLPGEIHVYAARVTPGVHTISLKFYDINDQYLPRFDLTRHMIAVPDEGDVVLLLHAVENQDNAYLLTQVARR